MRQDHILSQPMADNLKKRFDTWIEKRSVHLFRLVTEEPDLATANVQLMQREIGHAQKQALLRLFRRGVLSEEVYSDFVANIDELMRSPSTMDWILAAELKEGLENLEAEDSAAEGPDAAGGPDAAEDLAAEGSPAEA